MPTLFRFLFITGTLGALVVGGLYFLAVFMEPVPAEQTKPVPNVKIRRQ
ncbi:MAG: hypothetical protein KDJ41_09440 [Hyphomicrobiaceae bacterium]|nr:hypothetical protein [Hyphomicrobiaceae bacterium]